MVPRDSRGGGTLYGTPAPEVRAAFQARERARFDEDAYRAQHVRAVYDEQYWASWIVLVLVTAIVIAGLLFSLAQARIAFNAAKQNVKSSVDLGGTVKFSPGGVEVTSSVLGTITLTLSALFLYLYLQTVYPITTAAPPPAPASAPSATLPE